MNKGKMKERKREGKGEETWEGRRKGTGRRAGYWGK
jgi:hypothetical protein